jgi:hypothetical protein
MQAPLEEDGHLSAGDRIFRAIHSRGC